LHPAPAASAPQVEAPVAVSVPPSPARDVVLGAAMDRLLAFHARFRELSAPDAAREQARLAADGSAEATLQLAWALGLPQAPGRAPGDLARALALLDPLARGSGTEAPLARLLQARLGEQRRLEEQLERQAQQQRDLQRRNEQLREQLDALRAIERSLGPRPPASAPRTP
jgi:predicted Zn-dependent peptidase